MINIIDNNLKAFVSDKEIDIQKDKAKKAYSQLISRGYKGNDFLGWLYLPKENIDILDSIKDRAKSLAKISELVVVIGIGGSYLGARAVIEALGNSMSYLDYSVGNPLVIYAGHHIGEDYMTDLLSILDKKEYSLIVISKSGTTTEPAIAFRILKSHLEVKYGKSESQNRIVAITDKSKGALRTLADNENYDTYSIADDVGGRFSVLTPVGLLPISVAGIDILELNRGALDMQKICFENQDFENNLAIKYAVLRNALYAKNYKIEVLVNYLPSLTYLTEWWKQLYGESEGKDKKGIFPAGVSFSTDLHSMGQYIQDGERHLFETMLWVKESNSELKITEDDANLDGLNFLSGKSINEVNEKAYLGTILAHNDGNVPIIRIEIPKLTPYYLGQLIYFFEFACAISGYMIDVNPFDQPGVEDYKNNMFALLNKPGFEDLQKRLLERL